jgi:hypothetical protein
VVPAMRAAADNRSVVGDGKVLGNHLLRTGTSAKHKPLRWLRGNGMIPAMAHTLTPSARAAAERLPPIAARRARLYRGEFVSR